VIDYPARGSAGDERAESPVRGWSRPDTAKGTQSSPMTSSPSCRDLRSLSSPARAPSGGRVVGSTKLVDGAPSERLPEKGAVTRERWS